jgi:hypothetical protein
MSATRAEGGHEHAEENRISEAANQVITRLRSRVPAGILSITLLLATTMWLMRDLQRLSG